MTLPLAENQILDNMAVLLRDFLPGSFNNNTSFPIAASNVGVEEFWLGGSKRPAILYLLENTLLHKRHVFCNLISDIVKLSISWRNNKKDPLTRSEIDQLNKLIFNLGFKIPALHDAKFLNGLPNYRSENISSAAASTNTTQVNEENRQNILKKQQLNIKIEDLKNELIKLSNLDPQARGIEFEKFLYKTFEIFKLNPRQSFRIKGEQIDGSFELNNETYLLEAKWHNHQIGSGDLIAFEGKVSAKSKWTRGLYVSYAGFTQDGLASFSKGRSTSIICMDGQDLWYILDKKLDLSEALSRKKRRAGEKGDAFVDILSLYPSL